MSALLGLTDKLKFVGLKSAGRRTNKHKVFLPLCKPQC